MIRECCLSIPSLEFCFCSSKQTEVVLDMTRYITNQVLEQRGMIGARIPNLHSLSNRNGRNSDAGRALCLNHVKSVLKTFLFLTTFKFLCVYNIFYGKILHAMII